MRAGGLFVFRALQVRDRGESRGEMRTPRAARVMILVLTLSGRALARHRDKSVVLLDFEVVEGLAIVQLQTSAGHLRLLADTGSNATTLDHTTPPGKLVIWARGYAVSVKAYPTQTAVFAQFNATVPKEQRLDGVLGQDFFSQFSSVTFDYVHQQLLLYGITTKQRRGLSSADH